MKSIATVRSVGASNRIEGNRMSDEEVDVLLQKIDITNDVLKQVVDPISNYITANPPQCNALNCAFGSDLAVGNVDLPNTSVNFPLKNLQLQNQTFAPNCYGGLKFC